MATGRIGVTPVLGTRWSKEPTGGTTSLSGLDDNSVSLVYSVGYEQVYRNGVLLSRGNDYTATDGTSITLTDATITGDIIEVFAQELVPLTDAISKGQFTAKGSLLSASAASTPAVLAVGSNGQVLKADSSTTTGLAWGSDSGKVLQVVTAQKTTYQVIQSTSYVDITSMSASITPTSTSSTILIMVTINGLSANNSTTNDTDVDISLRNGSNTVLAQFTGYATLPGSSEDFADVTGIYKDSPATTSSVTYKLSGKSANTAGFVYGNYDTTAITNTIVLMEIGA
jgi:hypothetical protein